MAQRAPTRSRKEPPPQVGAIFARRLRAARTGRGWTQQDLADALHELGAPMDRTTLAKIEKGKREVRLDELVQIAAALDVAIVHLIFPIDGDRMVYVEGEPTGRGRLGPLVRLAPKCQVNQVKARRWARGQIPLDPANFRYYAEQSPGDIAPSAEELSPDEQQALYEENRRIATKRGIRLVEEEPVAPTKRGQGKRSAGKEQ